MSVPMVAKSLTAHAAYLKQIEQDLLLAWPKSPTLAWMADMTGEQGSANLADLDLATSPVWELIDRGGKRWRPLVMVLSCLACDGDWREASRLSSLVELPHNGSLIIDDIEDNALLRRGKGAIHLIHGIDQAINSGNFAYFAPTSLIDSSPYPDHVKARLYTAWACGMRSVHMGQALDITWHNHSSYIPTTQEYLTMCRFKTGSLVAMASRLGAIIAGANTEFEQHIGHAWMEIGLAFQMLDDVINITTGAPGKKRGDDLIEGKKSLPVLLYCQNFPEKAQYFLTLMEKVAETDHEHLDELLSLLIESGMAEQAKIMAMQQLMMSKEQLNSLLTEGEALTLMNGLIDYFTELMA